MDELPSVGAGSGAGMLPPRSQRLLRHRWLIGLLLTSVILSLGLSTIGLDDHEQPLYGVVSFVSAALASGLLAIAWMMAAIGFGGVLSRLALSDRVGGEARWWAQLALGPAGLLWVDHVLGWLGLLSGPNGQLMAIGVLLIGIGLLARQGARFFRNAPRLPEVPWTALLGVVGVAILMVASASAPGWLWRSEAGGFDAMSYHLPLAQEWAQPGASLRPVQHNVYSFLPSYMEAAYLHIAALKGGLLVRGEGVGVLACQLLHALLTLLSAVLVGRVAYVLAQRVGGSGDGSAIGPTAGPAMGAGVAAALVVATPWSVVTGSLAYNEMAMIALAAGAAAVAVERDEQLTPGRRALACALLLGAACGCKPTALFLAGPTVGLLLLVTTARRAWLGMLAVGLVGGLVVFGPPLLRNWLAAGNPVFPAGVGVFGQTWGWSAEQVALFAKQHGREGGLGEAVGRLFAVSGGAGTVDRQPRGMMHEQWGFLFPAGVVCLVGLLLKRGARGVSLALLGGLVAGCVFWVVGTHGQSRFLMPLMINASVAVGLVVAAAWQRVGDRSPLGRVGVIAACLLPVVQSATLARIWLLEGYARPNATLVSGVAGRTGELLRQRRDAMSPAEFRERLESASPSVYVNLVVEDDESVLLVGDATPLYYTASTVYHTVWDRSPLGLAIEAEPGSPGRWTELVVKNTLGQTRGQGTRLSYVLVNFDELRRYWGTYGYDRAVTPRTLVAWLKELGEPVQEWMPEQEGLMMSWHDMITEDPRRWQGRALWRIEDGRVPEKSGKPGGTAL